MRTVLLVEDHEDNRTIFATILAHAGYRVLEAADGAAGLALAQAERPDLIVMDVTMPVLDGLTATRTLKADPAMQATPILVVTAHAMPTDREAALEAGADHYLSKPLDPHDLVAAVSTLLEAFGRAPD